MVQPLKGKENIIYIKNKMKLTEAKYDFFYIQLKKAD